ncbi:MAG: hypothetical protein MZW92_50215 [Comamonadaceae bacterium]|nr:hypothetical protein [Comamonadaceae bacterium]
MRFDTALRRRASARSNCAARPLTGPSVLSRMRARDFAIALSQQAGADLGARMAHALRPPAAARAR